MDLSPVISLQHSLLCASEKEICSLLNNRDLCFASLSLTSPDIIFLSKFQEESLVDDSLLQDDDEEEEDNESRSWRR